MRNPTVFFLVPVVLLAVGCAERDVTDPGAPPEHVGHLHERVTGVEETESGVRITFERSAPAYLVSERASPSPEAVVQLAREALASGEPVHATVTGASPGARKSPESGGPRFEVLRLGKTPDPLRGASP